jgi:hypothetical protein
MCVLAVRDDKLILIMGDDDGALLKSARCLVKSRKWALEEEEKLRMEYVNNPEQLGVGGYCGERNSQEPPYCESHQGPQVTFLGLM